MNGLTLKKRRSNVRVAGPSAEGSACPGATTSWTDLLRRHEKAAHEGRSCGRYVSPTLATSTPSNTVPAVDGMNVTSPATAHQPTIEHTTASLSVARQVESGQVQEQLSIESLTNLDHFVPNLNDGGQLSALAGVAFPSAESQNPVVTQTVETSSENVSPTLDFSDIYSQFDSFNTFLDLNDFNGLIPPDYALDLGLQDLAFTSELPQVAFNDNVHVGHDSGAHNGRVEPETSFSRFGSPLPALHFETREQASRPSGQAEPNANFRPVWKISGHQYRQIVANIQKFDHVLPKDFNMPSRHTMSRFLEGAIKGYYEHLPNLHVPTFSPVHAAPELILSMCAIGALFRFEAHRCPMLFHAGKAIAFEQIRIQEQVKRDDSTSFHSRIPLSTSLDQNNTQRPDESGGGYVGNSDKSMDNVFDPQTQTLQALIALMCVGAWGSQPGLVKESIALQSVAATLARDDGFSRLKVPTSSCTGMSEWHRWVLQEGRKRTKLMTYCLLQLVSVAYHIPPLILNSEIDCCLPCSAKVWNASSAEEWEEVNKSSPFKEVPFREAYESMFHSVDSPPTPIALSPMANYVLILAILQHLYLRRQTLASSKHSLSSEDIGEISRALRCWQTRWERSPESIFEPSSATGPVAFTSTALLRLAWIRLHSDMGPCRNLASRDASVIASAFENSPPLKRGPELIHPVLQAAHALSIPVRMGIKYVAKTQAFTWSVQHSFSNLECAIFLSKWLELIGVASGNGSLDKEEVVLVQMIQSLLTETGLFDSDMMRNLADRQDQKQRIRWLATAVARMWAEIFKGTHVFDIVNVIGASLTIYAESMETTYTPAN
ncbi:uncharacterized protein PV06_02934 [Exophiala oligosperma]|uniref:Xylanolytic transcriptional activator regulatory domain-containing protein n=1 Tax=Exophiala oligosperma TaxID=215243 RepID=A0A0D2DNP6_9EURO|nr:uncharacterized protein PV06_02934 [Exophiala oligosperma]KIW44468.1 hypothetical protein PV06_02934 [Exophiala oligosperma]